MLLFPDAAILADATLMKHLLKVAANPRSPRVAFNNALIASHPASEVVTLVIAPEAPVEVALPRA